MGMANLSCSPILNQLDADLGSRESSPPGLGIMRHSDRVLRTVLELADQRDLVLAVELTRLRQQLIDAVAEIDSLQPRADPAR